ncbi:MAG: transposase [Lachnospiraceae bacterium]|nr:transposase [Lachnospiraceae bacterium]
MLKALLLQLIFSVPAITLLIIFLRFSRELRDFCGFTSVPDASGFTPIQRHSSRS